MRRTGPKVYRSLAEFQREEIAPHMKCGFRFDDLESEATFNPGRDDSLIEDEGPQELNFDFG